MSKIQVVEDVRTLVTKNTVCDWCGALSKHGPRWVPIGADSYDFTFFMCFSHTDPYDGGSTGTEHTFDLCPKCARKLVRELRKMGVKVQKDGVDS